MPTPSAPAEDSRRTGDRREGGRRSTDQPRSKAATIAITASFLFSGGLMAWSFSRPFQSGPLRQPSSSAAVTDAKLEYEARLSTEDYLDYASSLDQNVFAAMREESVASEQINTSELNKHQREERRERIKENQTALLEKMKGELGEGETFLKGSIQWEYEQQLDRFLSENDD